MKQAIGYEENSSKKQGGEGAGEEGGMIEIESIHSP